jgi:uncharacterized protein YjbI with pentapeptide repeats
VRLSGVLAAGALVVAALASWPRPSAGAQTVSRVCTGCNFAGAALAAADFTNGVYIGNNFAEANLERASFRGAKLVAANFEGADLRGAAFDNSDCTACNFLGAKLDGATFSGVRMTAANFEGFAATVDDAALRQLFTGCVSCNFAKSKLSGRDLSGATLIVMDFSQADLRGTNFTGTILCWNNIAGTHRDVKCATMRDAQVAGAKFVNIRLCDDPIDRLNCTTIAPDTLRRYSGSTLEGAIFQ